MTRIEQSWKWIKEEKLENLQICKNEHTLKQKLGQRKYHMDN